MRAPGERWRNCRGVSIQCALIIRGTQEGHLLPAGSRDKSDADFSRGSIIPFCCLDSSSFMPSIVKPDVVDLTAEQKSVQVASTKAESDLDTERFEALSNQVSTGQGTTLGLR